MHKHTVQYNLRCIDTLDIVDEEATARDKDYFLP